MGRNLQTLSQAGSYSRRTRWTRTALKYALARYPAYRDTYHTHTENKTPNVEASFANSCASHNTMAAFNSTILNGTFDGSIELDQSLAAAKTKLSMAQVNLGCVRLLLVWR